MAFVREGAWKSEDDRESHGESIVLSESGNEERVRYLIQT